MSALPPSPSPLDPLAPVQALPPLVKVGPREARPAILRAPAGPMPQSVLDPVPGGVAAPAEVALRQTPASTPFRLARSQSGTTFELDDSPTLDTAPEPRPEFARVPRMEPPRSAPPPVASPREASPAPALTAEQLRQIEALPAASRDQVLFWLLSGDASFWWPRPGSASRRRQQLLRPRPPRPRSRSPRQPLDQPERSVLRSLRTPAVSPPQETPIMLSEPVLREIRTKAGHGAPGAAGGDPAPAVVPLVAPLPLDLGAIGKPLAMQPLAPRVGLPSPAPDPQTVSGSRSRGPDHQSGATLPAPTAPRYGSRRKGLSLDLAELVPVVEETADPLLAAELARRTAPRRCPSRHRRHCRRPSLPSHRRR